MKTFRILAFSAILACGFAVSNVSAGEIVNLDISPKVVDVGATYNGTSLTVTGEVPADGDVLVRFMGKTSDLHMRRKGKALGLLWMNMGSLTFKGVPGVCIVNSEKGFDRICEWGGNAVSELRPEGLKRTVLVEPDGTDADGSIEELIKLKKQEGLYREIAENVVCTPATDGNKAFKVEIPLPSRLSPGKYDVQAFAVKDGNIVARGDRAISVNLVGAPALMADLAFHNGTIYGILATIIAVLGGLLIGIVFQSKGAH